VIGAVVEAVAADVVADPGSKPWTFCPSQRSASGSRSTQTESRWPALRSTTAWTAVGWWTARRKAALEV